MSRYEGKPVVVTGGTSGIGLATAKLLVGEGARVLITGRSIDTVAAALEQLGEGAIGLKSDATLYSKWMIWQNESRPTSAQSMPWL
jgi:NAD(P)-dependent dehydrogenase (short-subunit alcohol dehydrogenase family)